jgi:hypothetical protein
MGFLDFLKKELTKPDPMPQKKTEALPPASPRESAPVDWTSIHTDTRPLPATLHDDGPDSIPVPPSAEMDFLQSAANTLTPTKDEVLTVEPRQPEPPKPEPPKQEAPPLPSLDLPDFSDEDLAALEQQTTSHWAMPPPKPELPKPEPVKMWEPPKIEIKTEEPLLPPPVNAVAVPEEEVKLPTGEATQFTKLEPAKFISSNSYFMILAENKAIRRSIRISDDIIKDAMLRHEQLDLQHKRVAADINAVQELFIKIDGALFE